MAVKLPDGYRECRCGVATKAAVCRACGATLLGLECGGTPAALCRDGADQRPIVAPVTRSAKGPNKTEAEYRRMFLGTGRADLVAVAFEGLTFRLANGHRYTPDWVCQLVDGQLICIEVKGSYRLGSYQRARLAFDQAAVEWPGLKWIWAERCKDGTWKVSEREANHGMS